MEGLGGYKGNELKNNYALPAPGEHFPMIKPDSHRSAKARMPSKRKQEPFACYVNNSTDFFSKWVGYIKMCRLPPLFAVCRITAPGVVTEDGEQVCRMARELLLGSSGTLLMQRIFLLMVTLLAVGISGPARTAQGEPWVKGQPRSVTRQTNGSLKQEKECVLAGEYTPSCTVGLEADGFRVEPFAKDMGHKVTVRGIHSTDGSRTRYEVRAVETICETRA